MKVTGIVQFGEFKGKTRYQAVALLSGGCSLVSRFYPKPATARRKVEKVARRLGIEINWKEAA